MRTKLRSKVTLLFMSCALLIAVPAIALADNISNTLDGSVDAVAESMPLVAGGANGTTKLYVNPTNGDGKNGCNITGGTQLTIALHSNNTGVATVSPQQVTFTSCVDSANGIPITVTPVAQGTATITATEVSNTTGATFNLAPVQFTANVAPPPNTPPQVAVGNVIGGASYPKGQVPPAVCQVTDAEDGNSSFPATLSAITGPFASDGIGQQTASCSYRDQGGLLAEASVTYGIFDPTPPVIQKVVTPSSPDGLNGWYKSNVSVDWTVSDPESPNSLQLTGCQDQNIVNDQAEQTYSCSATSAGGPAAQQSVSIKRDATPPQVTAPSSGVSGTAGTNGWYTSVVTQTFNASDATSGLVGPSSFPQSSGANEEGQNVNILSGPVLDNAGNSASASAGPFKVDLTDPLANCDSAPSGWSGSDVNIRCQPTDAISGLANAADGDFNLSTSVPNGTETANASTGDRTVADAAGRTVTAGPISGIKVDKKAPALTDDGPTAAADGANGWYTSAVTNKFTATDGGSGFAPNGDLTKSITNSSGTDEGSTVKIASGAVSDAVGNSAASIDSAAFKIDLSDPHSIAFQGGPAAGSSHYFGSVPAAPTCSAQDDVSGLKDCKVTGYSTAVGTHTMTATATDNAGRTATETRSYTVDPWTFKGFYQPVDMNNTLNTVKGGSTVPLKFELFAGSTELTDTANVVQPLKATKVACDTGATLDEIELLATGSTSLRYDSTAGQYIYNWQTPKQAGACYNVTITAQDGSSQTAKFKLK